MTWCGSLGDRDEVTNDPGCPARFGMNLTRKGAMAVKGVILMGSRVKDVMTTDVVSVRETAEYKDIVSVLRGLHVSAFPVLDEADHLVGVVSESDLLLKEVGQEALGGYLISSGRRGERAKAAGVVISSAAVTPAAFARSPRRPDEIR